MPATYVTDEPHRGAIGDLRPFQMSGFEGLRSMSHGEFPGPPPSRMFGSRVTDVGLGKATFSMPMTRWLEDAFGFVWAGIFAMFADAPLGSALWTGLPAGKSVATSELNMSFLRPPTRATTDLIGRAETVHLSRQVGLSSVHITDQSGRLMAYGSTKCLIVDIPADLNADYPTPDTGPDEPEDPYLRPPPPPEAYVSPDEIVSGTPIELQRSALAGGVVFPIWRMTGVRPTRVDDGL